MNGVTGTLAFLCLWSILFLCALPLGVEVEKKVQKGCAESAPKSPKILQKLGGSFFVCALLFALLLFVLP